MSSINKCVFMGNLTRDPEIKYTPKGTAIADIGLAVNRKYTTESGEKREEVTFLNLTAFGRTAEIAGEYLKKGRLAYFECRANLDQWDDKQTGQKRSAIKFIVNELVLLPSGDRRPSEQQSQQADDEGGSSGRSFRKPATPPPKPPLDPDLDADGDDIPFRTNQGENTILTLVQRAIRWILGDREQTLFQMRTRKAGI